MTKPRKKNKGLPRRVYLKDGAYRFLSPEKIADPSDGKFKFWIKLARADDDLSVMYAALGKLLAGKQLSTESMAFLCQDFKEKKLKKYSEETQITYGRYLDAISADFEEFHIGQVTTRDFAQFLINNYADKPNTAQKIASLGMKMFKYAISSLGARQDNPIVQLDSSDYVTTRREFLPKHDQIKAIRAAGMMSTPHKVTGSTFETASGPMFACIIDMTYLCWMRAIDVRMLKESQIEDGRIRLQASKTKKTSGMIVDIIITDSIQEVLDRARAIKKKYGVISPFLFPTKKGTPYVKSGLTSMWERARERAGLTKEVSEVQFRDLRALGATDAAKAGAKKDEIRKRLSHTTTGTSDIYIKEAFPEKSEIVIELPWNSL